MRCEPYLLAATEKRRQRTYVLCRCSYSVIPLHIRPSKGKGSPHLRYRPQTMKNGHEWWKYVYDEFYNCVICPEYQPLKYSTTNRDGYREYKSDPNICAACPTRERCTHSRDCIKTVQRHIWKDYEELADDARYTPAYAQLYKCRKETIERVFADAKEKHAMRYTQYRGLAQVTNWVKLKFVAMNLKKLATWKWRDLLSSFRFAVFSLIYVRDPVCS